MFSVDYFAEPYVNDFDRDGICETWLVYQLGCRSDFSGPNLTMKIIMHSSNKKYAIRGERDMLFPQSYGISPELGKFKWMIIIGHCQRVFEFRNSIMAQVPSGRFEILNGIGNIKYGDNKTG